jgi:hypothetical protein
MTKLISLALVGITILAITACKKASVIEVNSLVGSPGNCTSPGIVGTYTKGVPLDGTQKVTIQIDLKNLSSIVLSTNTVNGVFFEISSTSLFPTATGVQSITLGGAGTPINSGTFTFTPTLHRSLQNSDISTCTFSITFN